MSDGGANGTKNKEVAKSQPPKANQKKRRNEYDEEDDGFMFTRVKKKKPRISAAKVPVVPAAPIQQISKQTPNPPKRDEPALSKAREQSPIEKQKKRRNKLSFSTPITREPKQVRKSKRLSAEVGTGDGSPQAKLRPEDGELRSRKEPSAKQKNKQASNHDEQQQQISHPPESVTLSEPAKIDENDHSATKIALPFADTPVISRNKAMRLGKQGKGERRSSLGLRGRRASSLIDSGISNALPHSEVGVKDFYKHIESELIEPRRMRQLLSWCATRAMHAKPQGTNFEDASAKSAVRVIEEELLKELGTKSELSDWFNREEATVPVLPLPERPNPKNVQNSAKITELEQQIQRLRREKDALEGLLKPPRISRRQTPVDDQADLLSESDAAILKSLTTSSSTVMDLGRKINTINQSLEPTIDQFADGIHQVAQYCNAADNVAGRVLSICAEKLASREREGRKKALHSDEDDIQGPNLMNVLRSLSRADR